MDAIRWVQDLPFSTWMRESSWAVFTWLILHMWGLGFLAGGGALVAGRSFGLARGVEPKLFERFIPVMWAGFLLAAASGVLLLMSYPAKALTNPVFYVKFVFLIGAAVLTHRLLRDYAAGGERSSRRLAVMALLAWVGLITCGNLLKYTHSVLLVY
jgi:hypothetical protein